jgi:hypothetical protein
VRVKTFDATCGAIPPISIASLPELDREGNNNFWRKIMTRKERIEGAWFLAVVLVGFPAAVITAKAIAG